MATGSLIQLIITANVGVEEGCSLWEDQEPSDGTSDNISIMQEGPKELDRDVEDH